ncbi:MAG: hypothetical protein BGO67_09940 [Alphaproteobacteria bacterium 41-28]|nr:MAG: hypothetical protein BGO67_09940 [Alphaproteobacteria bacterium 41-28]
MKKKEKLTLLLAIFVSISAISNLNAGMRDQDGEEIATSCLRWLVCCANPSRQDKAEHFYQKGMRKKAHSKDFIESGGDVDEKKAPFAPLICDNAMEQSIISLGVSKYLGHQKAGIEYEELLFNYIGKENTEEGDMNSNQISDIIQEKYYILNQIYTILKSNINELSIAQKVEEERRGLENYFEVFNRSKVKVALIPASPAKRRSPFRANN